MQCVVVNPPTQGIKEVNSIDEDFNQVDTIEEFETQPAIDIEPDSIYNEMNEHVKDAKEPDKDAVELT